MRTATAFMLSCCFATWVYCAESLRAFQSASTVEVWVGEHFFTSYRYDTGEKLPYFFPINGISGLSVTSVRNPQYPHHASLWFGCDRVNGGNYWQNAMSDGRIITESLVLEGAKRGTTADLPNVSSNEVIITQQCIWRRPNAPEPLRDTRRYVITAPSANLRIIDVSINLKALIDVKIEKTNHSFFSLRTAFDLSVPLGGTLINAEGLMGEKATFGQRSPWMAFYGRRQASEITEGIALLQHPNNPWYPAPWFTRDYGFISPTPMYWPEEGDATLIKAGNQLQLRYRIVLFAGTPEDTQIAELFKTYAAEKF